MTGPIVSRSCDGECRRQCEIWSLAVCAGLNQVVVKALSTTGLICLSGRYNHPVVVCTTRWSKRAGARGIGSMRQGMLS